MEFMPKREHARFCSARCRVAWNRENWNLVNRDQQKWGSENWDDGDRRPGTEPSALGWALVAMRDTTDRLGKVRASDRAQAFAVIGEAVWWVTIVDATLVRYYPDEYDGALAGLPGWQRRVTEATFGGLRFVRNRMGYYADHADFIQPRPDEVDGRRRADHRVDLAVAARPDPGDPAAARPGMGAEPVPGVPGPAGRPPDRRDLRARLRLPDAGRVPGGRGRPRRLKAGRRRLIRENHAKLVS